MRRRRGSGSLVVGWVLAGSLLGGGCMVPTYHLPGGFSGTYHRHLYGMESAPCAMPRPPEITTESRRAIFYPATAFQDSRPVQPRQAASDQDDRDATVLDPMKLVPDAPKRTAVRNPSTVFD